MTPKPEGHMASYIGRRRFLAMLGGAAARQTRRARLHPNETQGTFFLHFFSSCAIRSIAGFHNTCWSRMNAVTSSGDIERANDPRAASSCLTSAISSAERRASLALAMIGSGVPFGANTASQLEAI